jgi:hypothetical protein
MYSIANMVVMGVVVGESKKKFLQFIAIFWLLKQSCPLTNFEAMKMLFENLKSKIALKNTLTTMLKGDYRSPTMHYPCYNKSYGSCNEVHYNRL